MSKIKSFIATVLVSLLIIGGVNLIRDIWQSESEAELYDYAIPESGDGTGYYRHFYEELNSTEKTVYSIILEEIYSQPDKIQIPVMDDGDLEKIFHAISYDNPDLFNLGLTCKTTTTSTKCYFTVDYTMSYNKYERYLNEVNEVVQTIVDGAMRYPDEYSREKYVHDYIVNNCTYVSPTDDDNSSTVYGCLVEGKASCEGYSRSFQYILNKLNIDNRLVTGEGASEGTEYIPHMWNYVCINERWYFVDVTWDDPVGDGETLCHTYFNVTTSDILKKHRNIQQNVPQCINTADNYFVRENLYFTTGSGDTFSNKISNAVVNAVNRGDDYVEFRFSDIYVMDQAYNSMFEVGIIFDAFRKAGLAYGNEVSVNYSRDDCMYTIVIYF